jgi:hypothetical protein
VFFNTRKYSDNVFLFAVAVPAAVNMHGPLSLIGSDGRIYSVVELKIEGYPVNLGLAVGMGSHPVFLLSIPTNSTIFCYCNCSH